MVINKLSPERVREIKETYERIKQTSAGGKTQTAILQEVADLTKVSTYTVHQYVIRSNLQLKPKYVLIRMLSNALREYHKDNAGRAARRAGVSTHTLHRYCTGIAGPRGKEEERRLLLACNLNYENLDEFAKAKPANAGNEWYEAQIKDALQKQPQNGHTQPKPAQQKYTSAVASTNKKSFDCLYERLGTAYRNCPNERLKATAIFDIGTLVDRLEDEMKRK